MVQYGVTILSSLAGGKRELRRVTREMSRGGLQLATTAAQITNGSQNPAQGATPQAELLKDVSAMMNQIAVITRKNGSEASAATETMGETLALVDRLDVALAELVSSMKAVD